MLYFMKNIENLVGKRIKTRRLELGLTQTDLAERVGYKYKSSIQKIEAGLTDINTEMIKRIANALSISPFELVKVPSYDKETGLLTIPFLSQKLSAGPGEDFLSDDCLEVRTIDVLACMLRGVEDRSTLVCAEAKGDSMVGARIYSGDYVVFSRGMVSGEGIYVLSFGGDVLVKRIAFDPAGQTVTIISANPDYPPRTVDSAVVRLLGKVVGWIHAEPA